MLAVMVALAGCTQPAPRRTPPVVPAKPPAKVSPSVRDSAMAPVTDLSQARAAAPGLSLRRDAPLRYVVKRGDTLWDIAGHFLSQPWQWPQLWHENPQIANPHLIYPGQTLALVWVGGRPRLANTERLEPQVREKPLSQAVPTIPLQAIREFLNGPRLIDRSTYDDAPAIAAFPEGRLMAGAQQPFYATGMPDHPAATWSVVQLGQRYVDPDTGDLLGHEAIPVGEAALQKAGHPAQLLLTKTSREALIGDRLLPPEGDRFKADFYPHSPSRAITGRIISVFDGVAEIGQYDIVALDRGARDGLDAGTVLSILQAGPKVPDPRNGDSVQLPDRPAGLLMVFKVTPRLSYALVMKETRSVHVMDKVAPPVPPLG